MDGGSAAITNSTELVQARRQARMVHLTSLTAAILLTLLAVTL